MLAAGVASAQVATIFELTGTATTAMATAAGAPPAAARSLRKGDGVNQGESVTTGAASNIVLRFLDGQVVALAANSTFTINNYTYNVANPAQSNVLLSLVNGGMRAITGLIGKARPQAVSYRVGNATIGVRGTDVSFAIRSGNIVVNVELGLVTYVYPGRPNVTIQVGQGAFQTAGGKLTTGNPKAIANAIAAAMVENKDDSNIVSVLSQMAGALIAVTGNADLKKEITTSVQGTGIHNAAQWTSGAARLMTNLLGNLGQTGTTTTTVTGTTGSGGGGTLPLCSTIVSPTAPRPGVNCRTS